MCYYIRRWVAQRRLCTVTHGMSKANDAQLENALGQNPETLGDY
jgi:hypothetical protein